MELGHKVGQQEHVADDAVEEKINISEGDGKSVEHGNPKSARLQELFRVSHASEVSIWIYDD